MKLKSNDKAPNFTYNTPDAQVLVFDDIAHPVMPIREHRWHEYLPALPPEKRSEPPDGKGARHANPR